MTQDFLPELVLTTPGFLVGLVVAHALELRLLRLAKVGVNHQKNLFLLHLLFNLLPLGWGWYRSWSWPAILYGLVCYNLMGYAYFHLFNMSDTARRIRMLLQIQAGEQPTQASAYGVQQMVEARLERLLGMGQLSQDDQGQYHIRGRLLLTAAKALRLGRSLLGCGSGKRLP